MLLTALGFLGVGPASVRELRKQAPLQPILSKAALLCQLQALHGKGSICGQVGTYMNYESTSMIGRWPHMHRLTMMPRQSWLLPPEASSAVPSPGVSTA